MYIQKIKCPKGFKKFYIIDSETYVSVEELDRELAKLTLHIESDKFVA